MTPNPFAALLHSRKFLLAAADALGSVALLLATRYLSPGDVQMVKELLAICQPVIVAVILGIAHEDAAKAAAAPH